MNYLKIAKRMLARGYLNDGELSEEEIDRAFVDNIPAEK